MCSFTLAMVVCYLQNSGFGGDNRYKKRREYSLESRPPDIFRDGGFNAKEIDVLGCGLHPEQTRHHDCDTRPLPPSR